jgi:hypothetical protein
VLGCQGELAARQGDFLRARERRRSALVTAAAAPLPIALDEAVGVAVLELEDRPFAGLTALAYIRRHPLTRPTTRMIAEEHWSAASHRFLNEELVSAEATAKELPLERPAALLELIQPI